MKTKILITGGSGFIGTNFVEIAKQFDYEILNIDINKPKVIEHNSVWKKVDILNYELFREVFDRFLPNKVLHLAARTDITGSSLAEYNVNIEGTKNLLKIIKTSNCVNQVVITSTQFVHQNNGLPKSDYEFYPYTFYGESKVLTEKLTRDFDLPCTWTIIRPTNIWGPWHPRYPHEFWKIIAENKYIHPNKRGVVRSYGYVKNVVYQILTVLKLDKSKVGGKVFYVGDEPLLLIDWVNAFSKALIAKDVKVVPSQIILLLAILGDILKMIGIKFPITTSRYKSMTSSNTTPMNASLSLFGQPRYNLDEAVKETVEWLSVYYPRLIKI